MHFQEILNYSSSSGTNQEGKDQKEKKKKQLGEVTRGGSWLYLDQETRNKKIK